MLPKTEKREVKQSCLFKVIWPVYLTPPPQNAKWKQNGLRDMFFPAEKFDIQFFLLKHYALVHRGLFCEKPINIKDVKRGFIIYIVTLLTVMKKK